MKAATMISRVITAVLAVAVLAVFFFGIVSVTGPEGTFSLSGGQLALGSKVTSDSGVELDAPDVDERAERVRRYMSTVADNEELMRIFERTYGPVKKRNFNEPEVKMAVPAKKPRLSSARPLYSGSEYLLVDGYNIIYAWNDLKNAAAESLDLARNLLINRLCNYQAMTNAKVILVFDAYKVKGGKREIEKVHGITVVYTKEAETADQYIEKTSTELSKNYRVRVATSDGQVQMIIFGNGAIRVPALEFEKEVMEAERKIKEFIENGGE